jgi:hypothetical protein
MKAYKNSNKSFATVVSSFAASRRELEYENPVFTGEST